jgi:hypothetical protein
MDEMDALSVGEPEFFDLKQPWLYSLGDPTPVAADDPAVTASLRNDEGNQ